MESGDEGTSLCQWQGQRKVCYSGTLCENVRIATPASTSPTRMRKNASVRPATRAASSTVQGLGPRVAWSAVPVQQIGSVEDAYYCLDCDQACDGCDGDGPDSCHKCTKGSAQCAVHLCASRISLSLSNLHFLPTPASVLPSASSSRGRWWWLVCWGWSLQSRLVSVQGKWAVVCQRS